MVSPVPLTKKWTNLSVSFLSIALLVALGVAVFWILDQIQINVNERLASTLQVVLQTSDKALQNWTEQTEVNVAVLADNDELRRFSRLCKRACERSRGSLTRNFCDES